jgi:3-deoxy-D-manno-octulosonate 8-phosphate phosphatase (KDO 8-P phosphatase)
MRVRDGHDAADVRRVAGQVRLVAFDFDGVFTDNTVYVTQDGVESVRCWRSDGLGLQKLQAAGIGAVIISTEKNPVVSARSAKLKITCHQGCDDKLAQLREVAGAMGAGLDAVAYVGNDINDAECLGAVALPIVVDDAHADVLALGLLRTRMPGGRGAVREVCDYLVAQRGHA